MKTLILKFCIAIIVFCCSIMSFAQSNGDKLFMEGQKLQQNLTIPSQNQAIKKFQSAKVVYTTADKKKMCDNQIAICNSNITSLKKGGNKNGKISQAPMSVEKNSTLKVSQNDILFDGDKAGTVVVNVESTSADWEFYLPEGIAGETNFVKVSRGNSSKSLEIVTEANPSTQFRQQTINVTYKSSIQKITIKQRGKDVKLATNTSLVEFGVKGGSKSIELYTNSDSIVASNNNLTWYVESKPDWIELSVEMKKKKGIVGKGISAIKGIVEGKVVVPTDDDIIKSDIKLVAIPLSKTSKEYQNGRRGEIVFASQDKKYRVVIVQQD